MEEEVAVAAVDRWARLEAAVGDPWAFREVAVAVAEGWVRQVAVAAVEF